MIRSCFFRSLFGSKILSLIIKISAQIFLFLSSPKDSVNISSVEYTSAVPKKSLEILFRACRCCWFWRCLKGFPVFSSPACNTVYSMSVKRSNRNVYLSHLRWQISPTDPQVYAKKSGRIYKLINPPGIMSSCCYEINMLTKRIQMLLNMCFQ